MMIRRARQLAIEAHGDQKYGDSPYIVHLEAVVEVLVRFHYTREELLTAAYLHDVLEDTDFSESELRAIFGDSVYRIVKAVTNEPGPTRKERLEKTYPKIKKDIDALTLKLADRIANVEASIRNSPENLSKYRAEYNNFRLSLYVFDIRVASMWDHLDQLMRA